MDISLSREVGRLAPDLRVHANRNLHRTERKAKSSEVDHHDHQLEAPFVCKNLSSLHVKD